MVGPSDRRESPSGPSARPSVFVVSYHAANPLTPRGGRTQAVVAALARRADVRVVAGPSRAGRAWWHRARDRALFEIGSRWLIDPLEPWAWKAVGRGLPDADVALLIGYPFSPMVVAARALRRQGVPYVLDISDPWALTRYDRGPRTLRDRRGARLERRLWRGASAGIVTTEAQARDLLELVPDLDVLVRPNGYADAGRAVAAPPRRRVADELWIGHFGNLYAPRLGIEGFVRRLAESPRWRRVVIQQYGRDHHGELRKLSKLVTVEARDPVPWPEAARLAAAELDLALVVGNKDPRQLPSKASEYLTLPVPRVALTGGLERDALAAYVEGRPGWMTLNVDDPDAATRIWNHVRRSWTREELAPPADEAWACVAEQLATFVLRSAV